MKKIHILFVIDSFGSGGAEKSLVTLLNLIDYDKVDIDVGVVSKTGLYLSSVPNQVNVFQLKKNKSSILRKFVFQISFRLKNILKIKRHTAQLYWAVFGKDYQKKADEYDVVVAYSQGLPTYFCDQKTTAKKKIAWVNTNYKLAGYNEEYDQYFYRNYRNIVLVSEQAAQVFKEAQPDFQEKVHVIKDIISGKLIRKLAALSNTYSNTEKIKILTIGRLVHIKGYDYLIDAAEIMVKKKIDFIWYIIGEGILESKIKSEIITKGLSDHIHLLGAFENPYPFILNCDIYCQPSRMEGYGLAVAEARILNKPIVATCFTTITEQIHHGVNGLICQMSGADLAYTLITLIQDKQLRKALSDSHSQYDPDTSDEIKKFYELIL